MDHAGKSFTAPSLLLSESLLLLTVWNGAAPRGPKPRDTQQNDEKSTASRKRAASTSKQSTQSKTAKKARSVSSLCMNHATRANLIADEDTNDAMEGIEESELPPRPPTQSKLTAAPIMKYLDTS